MYYNYGVFNTERLFLRFNGLAPQYNKNHPNQNSEAVKLFQMYVDEFLFKADCIYSQLDAINKISGLIELQFNEVTLTSENARKINPKCPQLILPKNVLLPFNTTFVNQVIYRIPPVLNLINVLQDRILRIIGLFAGLDKVEIPQELSRFFDPTGVPLPSLKNYGNKIELASRRYWRDHGKMIRKYRNLDQHAFNILYNYGINSAGDFIVYFPDNPSEKNFKKVFFSRKINGLKLLNDEFQAFHSFVEELMQTLGIPETMHQRGASTLVNTIEDFNEKECMEMFQSDGSHVVCLYLHKKGIDGKSGTPSMNELPLNLYRMQLNIE